jgi:trigger factor
LRSTLEPVEPTKVRINVVVEPDELRPAIDRTARRLSREVRVPGFRKGKVPRQVIEARIGRDALLAEAIEQRRCPSSTPRRSRSSGSTPCPGPRWSRPTTPTASRWSSRPPSRSSPSSTCPPTAGSRSSARTSRSPTSTSTPRLERLRERFAQLEVIGRPLAEGDFAQIDLRATHHTEEIPELTRSDFLYEVGSGTVVPKLDEELTGKRKGDILKFNATLPEEAGEELAGREVTFSVLVKEAKAKVLPKLDDDFAQEASEFDTLDELRADLRERLEQAAETQRRSELETRVLQAYLDQVEVPLPETLVHDELHYRANRFAQQLRYMGASLEQYLEALGQTQEQVEADLRAQAERAVKAQLVLEAIARTESFEAGEEEIEAELQRQAARANLQPEQVRQALSDGRGGVIAGDILRSKALAFLVEHAAQHDPAPDDASEPKE